MRIEEVADGVLWIAPDVPGSGIVFSSYLIRGEVNVLIEPGPTAAIPSLLEALKSLGIESLQWIIPTHIHMDHAGGLGALAARFPEACVIVHSRAVRHILDPARLIQDTRAAYGPEFKRVYGGISPVLKHQIRETSDRETIAIDGRSLEILPAPGHAPHHVFIYDSLTQGIFCGEALGMATDPPLPAPAAPNFDLETCLNSMGRALALTPRMLFYSHGSTRTDATARIRTAMANTRAFADMVLEAMKQHVSPADIGRLIRAHAEKHFPPEWQEEMIKVWLAGMRDGYIGYFAGKGLPR